MELYSKEQMKDSFIRGVLKGMAGSTLSTYELFEMYISEITPIELPTNKFIEKAANTQSHYEGAMWLKQQILNQNNL